VSGGGVSAAPTDCRVPDPSDRLDAKADGQFQAVNRRAGYGDDRLDRIIATARKGWTLAAGEGLVLVQEIDRLREELAQQSITLSAEHQRAERILAALREPTDHISFLEDENKTLREERDAMCEKYRAVFVAAKIWEASFNTPTALEAAEAWDDNNAPEYRDACATLLAAVAAAEQEVANDER
jgi:hypothetical protein